MDQHKAEQTQATTLENIITTAVKIPGVKVNRDEFLAKMFANKNINIDNILAHGPVAAGCSQELLGRIADKLILNRTSASSAASFAMGIPGGLALAATIPADTIQFFGMTLRLAQELSYLYGAEDLWKDGELNNAAINNQLILYCGVMFSVSGAAAGVRLLSSRLAQVTLKKLPQKTLMKTIWYPILKQICKAVGVKVTKTSLAKVVAKALPVVGGAISGGLNFASMMPMAKRLKKALDESQFDYTEEEISADYETIQKINIEGENNDIIESADFTEIDESCEMPSNQPDTDDAFIKIEKLAKLKEIGAITQEEYDIKKAELLQKI